jgi:uncharacterized damage-inducible protein DinB
MSEHHTTHLADYLHRSRNALLWKLDGLSEYDVRRPLTPTGSNLLGIVKHVASVELGYMGDCFGRPSGVPLPWFAPESEPNADMFATADETRGMILELAAAAARTSTDTLAALPLDAPGRVPWWGERGHVTLLQITVHLIAEINRHAGHADILRELIDGQVGYQSGNDNLAEGDGAWWKAYYDRVEQAARAAAAARP